MDAIAFSTGQLEDFQEDVLDVIVNGRLLADVMREIELPMAEADGKPSTAGGYRGLPRWPLKGRLHEHFLGSPDSHLHCGPHDKTVLLGCGCGEPGCWPLMARVTVTSELVQWDDFEQPHRRGRWGYGDLAFRFDRQQYEAAVREAAPFAGD